MDAFESLVSMLLRREGYWTTTSLKVQLTKAEKRRINRASSPRWEIDVVAYKGSTNEILAVECKSFLDSLGVLFCDGDFQPTTRYKLFCDATLRRVVLRRLALQLVKSGACSPKPKVRLCMAVGRIAHKTDVYRLRAHFKKHGWRLFDKQWLRDGLKSASKSGYENDIAFVVSKLLLKFADDEDVSLESP